MGEVTKPGNPLEEFKQRVLEKLKADIGSLMPDEALAGMVQQAIKEAFFTKREVPKPGRSSYSNETVTMPSWFEAQVMEQIEPKLKAQIKEFVEAHSQSIQEAIAAQLDKNKMMILCAGVIGDAVRDGMTGAAMEFVNQLQNRGIIRY